MKANLTELQVKMLIDGKPVTYYKKSFFASKEVIEQLKYIYYNDIYKFYNVAVDTCTGEISFQKKDENARRYFTMTLVSKSSPDFSKQYNFASKTIEASIHTVKNAMEEYFSEFHVEKIKEINEEEYYKLEEERKELLKKQEDEKRELLDCIKEKNQKNCSNIFKPVNKISFFKKLILGLRRKSYD